MKSSYRLKKKKTFLFSFNCPFSKILFLVRMCVNEKSSTEHIGVYRNGYIYIERAYRVYSVYRKEWVKWFASTPKKKILGFFYFCIFYIARQKNIAEYIVRSSSFGWWAMQCLCDPSGLYVNSSFRNYYLYRSFLLSTTCLKRGDSVYNSNCSWKTLWKILKRKKSINCKIN